MNKFFKIVQNILGCFFAAVILTAAVAGGVAGVFLVFIGLASAIYYASSGGDLILQLHNYPMLMQAALRAYCGSLLLVFFTAMFGFFTRK